MGVVGGIGVEGRDRAVLGRVAGVGVCWVEEEGQR